LSDAYSFLEVAPENVVVTAFKKAEDDNDLVVRFYEWAGKDGNVQLQFSNAVESSEETNLMEKPAGSLAPKANVVVVPTKPCEIKTVEIRFSNRPPRNATSP
jgi:alpha-mannosidase